MTTHTLEPTSISSPFHTAIEQLDRQQFAAALWDRRMEVWPDDPQVRRVVANRLGWLAATDLPPSQLARLDTFAARVRSSGLTDVMLLGMGGSSLVGEVLHRAFGRANTTPRFHMLDSTDPDAVRPMLAAAATSLFIVASKSGTTIEPNSMAAAARRAVELAGIKTWGGHFVAITDEGTELHQRAANDGYLDVFVNPSDVGGRYSALTYFGLVPAALLGIPLVEFMDGAKAMAASCRATSALANPGLALGAFMAAAANAGRDKLVLVLPAEIQAFGLWVEQLVAESTGKHGRGIVPVIETSDASPQAGSDRAMVLVDVGEVSPSSLALLHSMRAAGVPTFHLHLPDRLALAGEFFRWEFATATAGWLLGVNPFDEPNVQQAKDATKRLLDSYTNRGRLPTDEVEQLRGGAVATVSRALKAAGRTAGGILQSLTPGDYVGVLAYAPPDEPDVVQAIEGLRQRIASRTGHVATMGFGPRYLHSTGQLHKGGANTGVFIVITTPPTADMPIPGSPYSFGVLEMAQAIGDYQSLDTAGRRAIHVHLPDRSPASFAALEQQLLG